MTSPARPSRRRRLIGFLLLWLVHAAVMTLVRLLIGWVVDGEPNWPEAAVWGVSIGLVIALTTWFVPSFPGGGAAEKATQRAITRGAVPADADEQVLRAGLLHVRRLSILGRRWSVRLMAGVTVGLSVLAVALGPDGVLLIGAGLCVVGLAVPAWLITWRLRRVDRLLAELDARDDARRVDRPVP
jgi:ABC-type multidrug transport system fused ATPase/permease subunit